MYGKKYSCSKVTIFKNFEGSDGHNSAKEGPNRLGYFFFSFTTLNLARNNVEIKKSQKIFFSIFHPHQFLFLGFFWVLSLLRTTDNFRVGFADNFFNIFLSVCPSIVRQKCNIVRVFFCNKILTITFLGRNFNLFLI